MDSVTIQKRLIEPKEKRLEVLMKQYIQLNTQMSGELSAAVKVSIEAQIRATTLEIEQLN